MTTNQKKTLRRSKSNRMIAGVCGGLAEFFGISSFWFRLALIIAFIPGGVPGLLIYFILWMVIPESSIVSALENESRAETARLFSLCSSCFARLIPG